MIKLNRKLISRGMVRIVPNLIGTTYEISNNSYQLRINIEQPERIEHGLIIQKNIKRTYIYTDNLDYKVGDYLPGNIYTEYKLKPITDDPEEHLLWVNGKVKRTFEGTPIYIFNYYVNNEYKALGEIDPPIPISG